MEPVIITAALTGSLVSREQTPHVPITPEEIAAAGVAATAAGASMLHIHVRDELGKPSMRDEVFEEVVARLRDGGSNAILNLTTGGAGIYTGADRYSQLALKPEMGSFDCGSMNFGEWVFENSPAFLRELAGAFLEHGAKPEVEVFDVGQIGSALRLRDEGLLEEPIHFQFVLGVKGGAPGSSEQLLYMRNLIPDDATWSICAIGRAQLPLNVVGILEGGHVRTGLEDNIYYHRGVLAESSAQLVGRLARIAGELGRPVATPDQARQILSLPTAVGS